jgi:uncharacterized membrane protein
MDKSMSPLEQDRLRIIKTVWLVAIIGLLFVTGILVAANGWGSQAKEWINLIVRWLHIIYGIAWIGASFYFIFLENALERTNVRDELAGNIWSIHGGGIYYLEKYKVAPKELPKTLHWFKWDAYFTWLTGFLMMIIVYYSDARTTLLTPTSPLSPLAIISIGIGSLVAAWFVYVWLSQTPLLKRPDWFALVGLILIGAATWALTQVMSGRGAYIHVGAMLGTIMAGNVFFVIIPSQKALIRAAQQGKTLDVEFVKWVQLRSRHNNYLTLPVLFTMISNHYPMTYTHNLNWLILILVFVAGVAVRHFINVTEKDHHRTLTEGGAVPYLLVMALTIMIAAFYISVPKNKIVLLADAPAVAFNEVQTIVSQHCTACHAAVPTQAGFASPPKGLMLQSEEQIVTAAKQIYDKSVLSDYMPLGNITGITPEERQTLGIWYQQGAKGN